MIGQKILHYQVTEKLGEGGMGVVYKAEDTKLGRTVALKFLNPQLLGGEQEKERLANEARAAAGLHHPNICTIYEINEHEGQAFIAMAYVDGRTLRDHVLSGEIDVGDALGYAVQIARGLSQAHAKRMIHRDIKSANIMIDASGQAVIMDFGLARLQGQPKPEERMSSGGTSAYMSPEQARGEAVDQRTDIWSLGVVLYEMLAGHLPFRGDYESAVIYSILNEAPQPIADARPGVPAYVVEIVERCLEKNPADRYPTLDEVIEVLRRARGRVTGRRRVAERRRPRVFAVPLGILAGLILAFLAYDFLFVKDAGSQARVPIAVIDFVNDTDEPALDGLSGMLITSLEQSRRLSVMTRTRMFDVLRSLGRDAGRDTGREGGGSGIARIDESAGQEICRAAGIDAMVIPSIRRFGDLYTIDVKVLDTRENRYLFTTKEEGRGQENIPRMIDKIAGDLRIDLREAPEAVAATTPVGDVTTVDLDAYQAYFDGEEAIDQIDFAEASAQFARAVEIDSTFALAYWRLAYVEWWSRGQLDKAREHVAHAMADIARIPEKERYLVRTLDAALNKGFDAQLPILREMAVRYPQDKEMLFGIGDAMFHTNEMDSSIVYFDRVLALDPTFERALQHLTWAHLYSNHMAQAKLTAERWVDAHPSPEAYENLGYTQFRDGEREKALETLLSARAQSDKSHTMGSRLAEVYLSLGRPDLALAVAAKGMESEEYMTQVASGRTLGLGVYPYMGRYRDALATFDRGMEAMTATTSLDSAQLMGTIMMKAGLYFWGWQDTEKMREVMEQTLAFPETYKKSWYYRQLAIMYLLDGDEARSRAALAEVDSASSDAFDDGVQRVARLAISEHCAEASALVDSLAGHLGEHAPRSLYSARFATAWCEVEAGEYRGAIRHLRPVVDDPVVTLEHAMLVPACYYFLGRAYEGAGDTQQAIAYYRRLLNTWEKADADLPRLIDARSRLDALLARGTM
ncbi:MAG: protein kinase [Candidatus Krumholzibacteria bacterium]|nr:protein kinase [Candidatus Krumholzibacteria bacterium]